MKNNMTQSEKKAREYRYSATSHKIIADIMYKAGCWETASEMYGKANADFLEAGMKKEAAECRNLRFLSIVCGA